MSNGRSLPKRQRNTHIHNCLHKELACKLDRQPSELRYCFICFDWVVEEKWDEHCQSHLDSITSKRCASITYCNTLVRPAFCPFCMSNSKLPASSRWQSWTRDILFWRHLESHLEEACWPSQCPHPLCNLQLDNEELFLFHLRDVHSLKTSQCLLKRRQEAGDSKTVVGNRKRQTAGPIKVDLSMEQFPRQPLHRKAFDEFQIISPHILSEVSVKYDALSDLPDLPELTYSGPTTPPGTDIDALDAGAPEDSKGLPETNSDEDELSDLFSQFVRFPSPPCSSAKGTGDDSNGSTQTVSPREVCLFTEESYSADLIDDDAAKSTADSVKVVKPRITLRIKPPSESKPKPKIMLRVGPQKSAHQATKKAKGRVNGCKRRRI
jgi:hypothetical protein